MVTGTIPLFVRFRRQATLNIILSRFRIYRLNSLRPVSLTMISPISSNIWSFAKALEFLWLIRAPILWYWKKERSRTITHLLICWKTSNVLWSRAVFFCNTITFYQTAHIIARNLARWRTNSNNFAILIVLHRKHRYPQLGCHFIFLMKIRRYMLQTETRYRTHLYL